MIFYLAPAEWDGAGHRAAFTAASGIWEEGKYDCHDGAETSGSSRDDRCAHDNKVVVSEFQQK